MKIQLIRPSGLEKENAEAFHKRVEEIKSSFDCDVAGEPFQKNLIDPSYPYKTLNHATRLNDLRHGLQSDAHILWPVRGGYGASDLLPELKDIQASPQMLIGFSDISALLSYAYTWMPSVIPVHSLMPFSTQWEHCIPEKQALQSLFSAYRLRTTFDLGFSIDRLGSKSQELKGRLFGGNFSVLTNLIGTPYIPPNLKNHILFFEDVNERPCVLIRAWNQWIHSGLLNGVQAVIFGNLKDCKLDSTAKKDLLKLMESTSGIPVYSTNSFGHDTANMPLIYGAMAHIQKEDQKEDHFSYEFSFAKSKTIV